MSRKVYVVWYVALLLILACESNRHPAIETDSRELQAEDRGSVDGLGEEVCVSKCDGKTCGPDACGGSCGTCNFVWESCSPNGSCESTACSSTLDCPGDFICSEELGHCVECLGPTDCVGSSICGPDHSCHDQLGCSSDKACKEYEMLCDQEAGVCVQCKKNSHCAPTDYCTAGFCLPSVCNADAVKCSGKDVLVCPDRSGWVVKEACPDSSICKDGVCHEMVCEPGGAWCDGHVAKSCTSDGMSVESQEDCSTNDQFCLDGACAELACIPGSQFCASEFATSTCSEDGQSFTTEECPLEHYCENGTCSSWECEPLTLLCEDAKLMKCNDLGSVFSLHEDCEESGLVCHVDECIECSPDCVGKDCGDDGCGGTCGECEASQVCIDGQCPPPGQECDDGNDVYWDGCTEGLITEFQVNLWASGDQKTADVAADKEGGYLIAWEGVGPFNSSDVFSRYFSPEGAAGPVVALGEGSLGGVKYVAVAAGTDGRFLLAWTQKSPGESGLDIMTRLHDPDGASTGKLSMVNDYTPGTQVRPDVAALSSGGYVVVWMSQDQDGSGRGVYARVLDADGSVIGDESQVNSETAGDQAYPRICSTGNGRTLVVWEARSENSYKLNDIVARFLASDGSPDGEEIVVNLDPPGEKKLPVVAELSKTEYLVAWESPMPGGSNTEVVAQVLSEAIPILDEEVWLNEYYSNSQQMPAISATDDGNAVATWMSWEQDGDGSGIAMRRFTVAGDALGDEAIVNVFSTGQQSVPSVAGLSNGGFIIVWSSVGQEPDGGGSVGVFAQRFSASGKKAYGW